MKRSSGTLLAALFAVWSVMIAPHGALGGDYYVATDGSYGNNGLTSTGAWPTITHALDNTAPGDFIHVGPGLFAEWLEITNAIVLSGSDDYISSNPPFERHQSSTVIMPPDTNYPSSPLIHVKTNGVILCHITINGDSDTNGVSDIRCGVYGVHRPLSVTHCLIRNIGGYGIRNTGDATLPQISDDDALMCDFSFNTISNIVHPLSNRASAVYLEHAPAFCDNNAIAAVKGSNALAGIYIDRCYYTSNMSACITANSNVFLDCTLALWANQFGSDGEKINVYGNDISNCVAGIRITAAMGQALVSENEVNVTGVSPVGEPARGIWLQADYDPWHMPTEHLVIWNRIQGNAAVGDGSVGILFDYSTTSETNINNGLRAIAVSNSVGGFDRGFYIGSGTNGIGTNRLHNPLVTVAANYNTIYGNGTFGFVSTGTLYSVDGSLNYWDGAGPYDWPPVSGNGFSGNALYEPPLLGALGTDLDSDGIEDRYDPDDDGDEFPDWKELQAGTNPTNASSLFQIASFSNTLAGGASLRWTSVTGRTYRVWRATNLLVGFDTILTNNIPGNPPFNYYTDLTATVEAKYFYRVTVTN